jgi:hypothetical protein
MVCGVPGLRALCLLGKRRKKADAKMVEKQRQNVYENMPNYFGSSKVGAF